jgi:methylated-DNA-[protein]-cysteine S-methyltransferase
VTVRREIDARFREAAAAEHLLDAAYDVAESPVGPLLVAASERGLCRIAFDPEPEAELERLARVAGPRVLRAPSALTRVRRELDEYFNGRRRAFDLEVDTAALAAFQRAVLTELAHVPYGETATYGGLAARIGKPRAARAVGGALNRNPIPIVLPCHRVVGAGGSLVGYAGGLERKRALLALEGAIPS